MKDNTESRYFIPYLAMADLCAGSFASISFTIGNFHRLYFPWDFCCKLMWYFPSVPTIASTLFLLAIAVQRYMRSKPFGRHFSLFWRRATVVIICTVSVCFSLPLFLFTGVGGFEFVYKGVDIDSINCQAKNNQYPTLQNVYFGVLIVLAIVNIVIIFILYICVAVVVYRRNRKGRLTSKINTLPAMSTGKECTQKTDDIELDSIETLDRNNRVDHSREVKSPRHGKSNESSPSTKYNKMFFTIVIAYVLAFIPVCVVTALRMFKEPTIVWQMQIYAIFDKSLIINNIVNPFIYGYFDMEFRKYLKKIVPPFCRHRA